MMTHIQGEFREKYHPEQTLQTRIVTHLINHWGITDAVVVQLSEITRRSYSPLIKKPRNFQRYPKIRYVKNVVRFTTTYTEK